MTYEDRNETVDQDILTRFDGEYATAEVEKNEPVPDGKYEVTVEKVELTRSRAAGNLMLKWTLRIVNGPHEGRCLFRHNMIVTPENLKWLKTDLYRCGLEIERLSDLPGNLEQLLDIILAVTKRTRDENDNVYIDRRIEIGDSGTGNQTAATDSRRQF